jgi:NADPH-dependent glutamate synthase beta subunit-like oxidoreductase/2,4-dienoyl-CoA reductase-like NADH-dependent reductase (Old Yellow Enzyme family)
MISPDVHSPFRLASLEDLRKAVDELRLDIPAEEDTSILAQPVALADHILSNSMGVQPMEGCDGTPHGAPDELTFRRYKRFAAGGAGLLWFEACAVVPEGRANPRQLWIHAGTKDAFARLLDEVRRSAAESMGAGHKPFCVLQLTHSGRYSRPSGKPQPMIAFHDPILDADRGIPADYPVVTDDYLQSLEDAFVEAAKLAFEAGFDAVDIKSCHRYLLNELLAAHTRPGKYGGSYTNRTRFLKNVIRRVLDIAPPGRIVTCRLGIYDAHPYPYGWGVDPEEPGKPNLDEPKRLVQELRDMGVPLINITMGNPYYNPHVNRPYDRPVEGGVYPNEHPLVGVARLIGLTGQITQSVPGIVVVGSGYSWLRNLWPHVAAAGIRRGWMHIAGVGRQAFAYPAFAKEIIETGRLERRHTCITCSSCTQIMRDGGRTGCVPFDSEIYGPIYREGRRRSLDYATRQAARCRDCFDPMCRDGCPAGVDIPGFVRAIANGDIKKSYEILSAGNVLPELCAYVCPADVQCQDRCVEKIFSGEPVPIRELQEFVARSARENGWARLRCEECDKQDATSQKNVAIVGAGPAGLACALRLLSRGYRVDLFDVRSTIGGVAASVIPSRRLTRENFEKEATKLLADYADQYKFHPGIGLSEDRTLDWFANHYDAVFLGFGLSGVVTLSTERPQGVEDAISFLERVKSNGIFVPERVAVLGGGNTAMDAATTALSCGARDVYLVYRRSFEQMPAWPEERNEALEMGVHFLLLTQPIRYITDENGCLKGLVIARTVLGEPDSSGRRKPVIVPNSECVLEVDMVIEALGQRLPDGFERVIPGIDLTSQGLIRVDADGRTSRPGVFAGGDVTNGGSTVVQAVADGMRAAAAIDKYLHQLTES